MATATIEIRKLPSAPGFPRESWAVEVRKPNGGLVGGSFGFLDIEKAELWGKTTARIYGDPTASVIIL